MLGGLPQPVSGLSCMAAFNDGVAARCSIVAGGNGGALINDDAWNKSGFWCNGSVTYVSET
jgi:hypothetical protein